MKTKYDIYILMFLIYKLLNPYLKNTVVSQVLIEIIKIHVYSLFKL